MEKEMKYLKQWDETMNHYITEISKFLTSHVNTHFEYAENYKRRTALGFNAFTLASETYYRENYHSYILKAFLDPTEKHGENRKYLEVFIDLINSYGKVDKIEYSHFSNAKVFREWQDIDILIKDDVSKKAIIIENKINNAGDQHRQLPRYYDIISETHDVLAIVYLPLQANKEPDRSDWTKEDREKINKLLCTIPSYNSDKTKTNLFHHWIIPAMGISQYADNIFILKHYGELIKYLNTNAMDTIVLEKFRKSLLEDNNYETAISIRNMLNDLPEYMANRILEKYRGRHKPFNNLGPYQRRDVVFYGFTYNDASLKLDIWCGEDGYVMHFWEESDTNMNIKLELAQFIPELTDFENHDDQLTNVKKSFKLNEEDELIKTIDAILNNLKEL
jgi:hypothetical protein